MRAKIQTKTFPNIKQHFLKKQLIVAEDQFIKTGKTQDTVSLTS